MADKYLRKRIKIPIAPQPINCEQSLIPPEKVSPGEIPFTMQPTMTKTFLSVVSFIDDTGVIVSVWFHIHQPRDDSSPQKFMEKLPCQKRKLTSAFDFQ